MDNAHRLQEIEIYFHSLVQSLQEGKLPVNIQNISQVFDSAIASRNPISSAKNICSSASITTIRLFNQGI